MHMRNTNIFYEALYYQINMMIGKDGKSLNDLREMMRLGYPSTIEEFDLIMDVHSRGITDQNSLVSILSELRQKKQSEAELKAINAQTIQPQLEVLPEVQIENIDDI